MQSVVHQTWWRHQMETFSALLALCAGNSPVPVNSPHKGQWRGALMFSLIYAWINDWVNNRGAGDLRRHRGNYDVIVMTYHNLVCIWGWMGLWGFLWWAPSVKRKNHHGVSFGWSNTWFHSNTGLSSTQYEQIPIIFGVWPFWLIPFFLHSITFWWVYCWIVFHLLKLLSFLWLTYYCSLGPCFSVQLSDCIFIM